MQLKRVFLSNVLINLAIFAAGGSLVTAGKEQVKHLEGLQEPKRDTSKVALPAITINHTIDFALGGALGITILKVIAGSIKLKRIKKELSSTISKLQQLETNDLPGIKNALEEFVRSEGIRYEASENLSLTESTLHLIDTVSTHVSSHNKAIQPFLEELQKLRAAFAQPFIDQLQQGGDVDAATKDAVMQVLRSVRLTEYLETVVLNALQESGAGEKIGANTISSLIQKDLVGDGGVVVLRETIADVFKSKQIIEALAYAIGNQITEYNTADIIVRSLMRRSKDTSQNSDPDLVALRSALANAINSEGVSDKLNAAMHKVLADPSTVREFVRVLQKSLSTKP